MLVGAALGFALLASATLPVSARARQDAGGTADQQISQIEARTYDPPRFGPARWLPGRDAYTTVEPAAPPATGMDIVRYDAASGAREVLVPAQRPDAARRARPGSAIDDYAWSTDGRRLLIFTNTRKVWRDNTRGDYWVLDLEAASSGHASPTRRRGSASSAATRPRRR